MLWILILSFFALWCSPITCALNPCECMYILCEFEQRTSRNSHTLDVSDQVSSVNITGYSVYVDQKPFFAQGIGYSPVPPDTDLSEDPNGDYFTSRYSDLWNRDLYLMREMNVCALPIYLNKYEYEFSLHSHCNLRIYYRQRWCECGLGIS